jgi:hypothetical protein
MMEVMQQPLDTVEIKETKPEQSVPIEVSRISKTAMVIEVKPQEVTKEEINVEVKPQEVTKEELTVEIKPQEVTKDEITVEGETFKTTIEHEAPMFTIPLTDLTETENKLVELVVEFAGRPPLTVTWYLDGDEIAPTDGIE